MIELYKSLIEKSVWVAIILFFIYCCKFPIHSLFELSSAIGTVVPVTLVIASFYITVWWRNNPFEKLPRIFGDYSGVIKYVFNDVPSEKQIDVSIYQNLLLVRVTIKTDEIQSNTVLGNIVIENGEYILYYNYLTDPKAEYEDKNPKQYGTCRLKIEKNGVLSGKYWTSRQTIGDITLYKK